MSLYLDTSVLVAALTNAARGDAVRAWMAAREGGGFSSSQWVRTDFSSALAMKLRGGFTTGGQRAAALSLFTQAYMGTFRALPITDSHYRAAAAYLDHWELGLRSGDALHLAIAAGHGETFCTLDRRMAEVGQQLGLATILV